MRAAMAIVRGILIGMVPVVFGLATTLSVEAQSQSSGPSLYTGARTASDEG